MVVDGSLGDQSGQFSGSEVLVLDQNRDGLEQITQALAARSGSVGALHIVSHGSSGSLALGAATLDAASLESYQAQLRAWADALTADADILFYGCNLAADEAGIGFVDELSRLTGADIAASTDLTGSAGLGGDWDLEYATGSIEADAMAASGDFVLATINYDATTDTLTFTADAGQADSVTITSPAGGNQLQIVVANGDTIVLTGDTGSGFTLNGTSTQLNITNTSAAGTPISVFSASLLDLNDSFSFSNTQAQANGLGNLSFDGGSGNDTFSLLNNQLNVLGSVSITGGGDNDTVTLNTTRIGGNLTLGTEVVTVSASATVDAGTNVINASGAGVTFSAASTLTAATFTAGSLNIGGGIVTLDAGTTAGALSLSGSGNLSGTGNVTVTGATTWSAGTMSGTGSTITQGALTISGLVGMDAGRLLDVRGGADWIAGQINLNTGSTGGAGSVFNRAGSTFETSFDGVMLTGTFGGEVGPASLFTNEGIFRKTGGAGQTELRTPFINSNVVEVLSGTLNLTDGGTHSGSFSGTGTLQFAGATDTHTLAATSSVTTNNVNFTSGTTNVGGVYNIAGTTRVNGGTANFNSALTSLGTTLIVSSGAANLGTNNATVTTFTQSGGTLSGTGNLTVTGVTTLSGGTMTGLGDTITQGLLTISGLVGLDAGRLLDVQAGANWTAGQINLNPSSTGGAGSVVNRAGSVFATSFDGLMLTGTFGGEVGPASLFTNEGIFRKTGGTGQTELRTPFNNSYVVEVLSGTLNLTDGGTHSGSFSGAGTLQFAGTDTHTLEAASSVTTNNVNFTSGTTNVGGVYNIAGTTRVNGGTANFNSPLTSLGATLIVSSGAANLGTNTATVTTFSQSGGTLSGTGNLTVTGVTTLSGGTMTGSGDTITQGALTISGLVGLDAGRLLDVRGGANWTAGQINLNPSSTGGAGSVLNRAGSTFATSFDGLMLTGTFGGEVGPASLFTNEGIFRKTGGTGQTELRLPFNNSNVVEVLSGTLSLTDSGTHSGSFSGAGTLQFAGSSAETHTLEATSSVTTSNANFTSGTTNIGGVYDIAITGTTRVNGGTANFNSTLTSLGATLIVSSGAANLGTNDATVTTFTQSGGTLSGTGDLTVSGASTLSGGSMTGSGDTITQGLLTINGSISLDAGRLLDVQGGADWTAGQINLNPTSTGGAGSVVNRAGSVFATSFNGLMLTGTFGGEVGPASLFTNEGIFRKTGGTGVTELRTPFDNTNAVEVQSGTVNLSQGGTHTGSFATAAGTTLQFGGGTHNLNTATAVSSLGRLLISSGTVNTTGTLTSGGLLENTGGALNAGGAINTATYSQSAGTLSGAGDLTVSGASTLSGGSMTGSGDTITQGLLTINGSIGLDAGRLLDVQSGASWTAGQISLNTSIAAGSGTIINRAGSVFDNSFNGLMLTQSIGAD
ncbi:MAG TPA: DUF4347 domain-containing protein, partial [Burkholderiales bacterium]